MGRGLDKPLLLTTVALVVMGLVVIYSAGQTDVPTFVEDIWKRQLVMLGVGLAAAVLLFRTSPRLLEWTTPSIYAIAMLLLGLTLLVGTGAGTAAGTRSWLAVAGMRIGQPAELAKIATILMLARHLGSKREAPRGATELFPAALMVGIPFVLIGLQPDLGSAIVFLGVLFSTLFWVGVSGWWLLLLASPLVSLLLAFSTVSWGAWIVVLTLVLLWVRPYVFEGLFIWLANVTMGVIALDLWRNLAPYQQNRLLSFLNPEVDPRATGWHIIQSKVAIGSGGLLGKGLLGEELGFVGVLVAMILFVVLLLTLVRIAREATDTFSSVVVFGFTGMLLTHIVVNVGMTVGLMPITGIPLPF
ncbi:MAG: FtsW/RodA/SpoVE family cell cycle protein, partial [Gemmatimonadales bacterium]